METGKNHRIELREALVKHILTEALGVMTFKIGEGVNSVKCFHPPKKVKDTRDKDSGHGN